MIEKLIQPTRPVTKLDGQELRRANELNITLSIYLRIVLSSTYIGNSHLAIRDAGGEIDREGLNQEVR